MSIAATAAATPKKPPLTIGVFGGSFNPMHLGHALLAITTQQTKPVDQVVLIPVYKHAVKRDLLPFDDRVNMCRLAIQAFGSALSVSTIEREVGASNGAMLQALKKEYPPGTKFVWICGDDFIRWMDKPKGMETLREVSGLIVQRRLHKQPDELENEEENGGGDDVTKKNRFIQEPLDEAKLHRVATELNLKVDFIYGELPHFSSTLVRRAPGHWRSFLTQAVVQYLDERPHLLKQLIANLEADDLQEHQHKKQKVQNQRTPSSLASLGVAGMCVLQGLDVVHALQLERGRAGLHLSTGSFPDELKAAQAATDARLQVQKVEDAAAILAVSSSSSSLESFEEVSSLVAELRRVPHWLSQDRQILEHRAEALAQRKGTDGWLARLSLAEKFNPRIDVLIAATIRALVEILEHHNKDSIATTSRDIPDLLLKWCEGKEGLGRLRAFVCAAGPEAPRLVQGSLKMRKQLNSCIDTKERQIQRVLALEAGLSSRTAVPDALHQLLRQVTMWEYRLLGSFCASTPIELVHQFLSSDSPPTSSLSSSSDFDVEQFFEASSSAIDFLLSFAKALAASACATA